VTPFAANESALRELLCEIGRRVWQRGFVASNDGNFSVRLSDGSFLATPTGLSKGFLQPSDIVKVDARGSQTCDGGPRGRRLTSEFRLHHFIYRQRPEVQAVVHAHPPHATAFAVAGVPLPFGVLPEIELTVGEVPTAEYGTTGTWDFAATLAPLVANHDAFLLDSHGAVTCGPDALTAYYRMESVDHFARVAVLARQLGGWRPLDPVALADLARIRLATGGPPQQAGRSLEEWQGTPGPADIDGRLRRLVGEALRGLMK